MNLEKITRIGCIALGLLGMIFLSLVFFTGDDTIKMAAASGDYGVITPIILLSQIVLFIAVLVTLTFSLRGISKDKTKMKNALKSTGLFQNDKILKKINVKLFIGKLDIHILKGK